MNPSKIGDPPDEHTVEWHWPTEWEWPADFRKFMSWVFLATSLQYLTISLRSIPYTIHQHDAIPLLHRLLTAPTISVAMATLGAAAWWTIWKGKSSAKGWAIGTSVIYLLIFVRQFIITLPAAWDHRVSALLIGTVGLVTFLWPEKQADA
jgi:hypothetical protein